MFGTLFKFGADTSQFSKAVMTMPRDVQRAQASINGNVSSMNAAFSGLAKRLMAVGAAFGGMYTVANSFKNALEISGRLNDMSAATGESAGNLAILERAFANSGVGAEKAGQTIAKVQKFVGDLGRETPSAVAAAKALGVTFADLQNKTPLEQMRMLAGGLSSIADTGASADISMLVFGTRTGGKMTALLKNFGSEIDNAKNELGSLPEILNKNAEALDRLGDKLANSIGNKLNEFAIGVVAGVQGTNDLVEALSKLDAAGAGMSVGKLFNFSWQAPLSALQALGNTLLSVGADIANEIAAQVLAAFKGLVNVIVSGDFWTGVGNTVQGALLKAARAFEFAIMDAIASAFEKIAQTPVAGRMFAGIASAARNQANQASDAYGAASKQMNSGMTQAGAAFMAAGQGIYNRRDLFGEAYYAGRAVSNYNNAMGTVPQASSEALKKHSATTSDRINDLDSIFRRETEKINAMNIDGIEKTKRQMILDGQYVEAKRKALGQMTQEAAVPEAARKPKSESSTDKPATQREVAAATESTLQRVAKFLEDLNNKLPQPVLV